MVRAASDPAPAHARTVGVALILASACLYGSGPLFARIAYDAGMSPLPLLAWRYVFAANVGWALVTATASGRISIRRLGRRDLGVLLFLGALFVVNAGTYTAALQTVPAGLVAIITYLYPALVAVISMRYARRLEGRRAWGALALSTLGVALAVGGIPDDADVPIAGLALAFVGAVVYAVWIVLAARLRGERPGEDPPDAGTAPATGPEDIGAADRGPDALASSAVMSTTTALTAMLLVVLVGASADPADVPGSAWPALAAFGAFSALAVVTFLAGTRRIGAARAALVSTFEPVYTIALATLLLGESLGPLQIVGGMLVVAGVLVAESGRGPGDGDRAAGARASAGPDAPEHATV